MSRQVQIDRIFKAEDPKKQHLIEIRSKPYFVEYDMRKRLYPKERETLRKRILKIGYQSNKIYDHFFHPIFSTFQPPTTTNAPPVETTDELTESSPLPENVPIDESDSVLESSESPPATEVLPPAADERPPAESSEFFRKIQLAKEIIDQKLPKIFAFLEENGKMVYFDRETLTFVENPKYFWRLFTSEEMPEEMEVVQEEGEVDGVVAADSAESAPASPLESPASPSNLSSNGSYVMEEDEE